MYSPPLDYQHIQEALETARALLDRGITQISAAVLSTEQLQTTLQQCTAAIESVQQQIQPLQGEAVPSSKSVQSEVHLQAILRAMPDYILHLRADGVRIRVLSQGEITPVLEPSIGQAMDDGLPLPMVEERMHYVRQALATGDVQIYEYRVEIDGNPHYEEARIVPLTDDEVIVVVRDISHSKRVEMALRESQTIQKIILESIPDLLIRMRADGTYLNFISGGDVRLFRHGEEIELMNLYRCIPRALADQRMEYVQAALSTGRVQQYDYTIEVDGDILFEEARIIPLNSDEVLVMIRDISTQKHLEETLRSKAQQEYLLNQILANIRRSLEIRDILDAAVTQVRQFLGADRMLFYQFDADWGGVVVAESVADPWRSLLGQRVIDHCLAQPEYLQAYMNGRVHIIEDTQEADLADCHLGFLHVWQVRANLLVPVKWGENLYGLFAAQQCSHSRCWRPEEIELMQRIADHFSVAIQQGQLYQQLQSANQELRRLATTDGLTQIANRLRFDAYLSREWYRLRREQQFLSLILFDVDCFKDYNDAYGHPQGDYCLKQIAQAVQSRLGRPADFVARYGGEEFAIVLPNTDMAGATAIADTILQTIRGLAIPHPNSKVSSIVTISLGIATIIPPLRGSPQDLIQTADKALYQAKKQGRDRWVAAP